MAGGQRSFQGLHQSGRRQKLVSQLGPSFEMPLNELTFGVVVRHISVNSQLAMLKMYYFCFFDVAHMSHFDTPHMSHLS
jgi:hypothetical protein